jgi:hypothetical protein
MNSQQMELSTDDFSPRRKRIHSPTAEAMGHPAMTRRSARAICLAGLRLPAKRLLDAGEYGQQLTESGQVKQLANRLGGPGQAHCRAELPALVVGTDENPQSIAAYEIEVSQVQDDHLNRCADQFRQTLIELTAHLHRGGPADLDDRAAGLPLSFYMKGRLHRHLDDTSITRG